MKSVDEDQLIQDKQELVDRSVKEYFYKTNYVKDNITKIYPEDVTITKEALDKLNAGVIAKLRNHRIEGLIINIDVVFEDNVHVHFGRWEDYKKYDWDNANSISSIILEWKFNVYVHETEFPQEQVLTVKMSNEIKPTELFSLVLSGNLSDVSDLESKFSPIVAQVTFTDRTFANELILLVTQWSEHVKNSKWTSKFALFLKKHKVKISKTVDFLTVFLIIFGSSAALLNHLNVILPEFLVETSKETLLESTKWVIALLIVFKFSIRIGHWFGNSLFNLIRDYGNSYVFNITKNDEEKIAKMQKQNHYDIIKGVGLVTSNILINLFFIFLDRII